MPADTFSPILGILLMATGNDNNNWGDNFNASIATVLENALGGAVTRNGLSGGTLDLSGSAPPAAATQALECVQVFGGTLTSDLTVIVPRTGKFWLFVNRTAGNFGLLVKTPTGIAVSIPQGTEKLVFCEHGTDNLMRLDRNDVGTVLDYAGTSAPPGTFECDGSAISRARYPDLFSKIGTTWGAGDGSTTFNLPNLKDTGRFRRSRSSSAAVGTYQSNQVVSHIHSVAASGSATTDAGGGHSHSGSTALASIDHTHAVNGNTGTESAGHQHAVSGTTDRKS